MIHFVTFWCSFPKDVYAHTSKACGSHGIALSYISVVGCFLSLIGLFLTMATYIIFRYETYLCMYVCAFHMYFSPISLVLFHYCTKKRKHSFSILKPLFSSDIHQSMKRRITSERWAEIYTRCGKIHVKRGILRPIGHDKCLLGKPLAVGKPHLAHTCHTATPHCHLLYISRKRVGVAL